MTNTIKLKHKGDGAKISNKFGTSKYVNSRCLNFTLNSTRARKIRAYAVNKLEADVYININQLL